MSSVANKSPRRAAPETFLAPVFFPVSLRGRLRPGCVAANSRGERVLDLYGGHAVAALGYGHPGWTDALTAQARTCNFQTNAIPMRIRVRAAERLVRFSKLDFTSVFFVNSGAEANENALRLAFRMTSRPHVAAVEGSFHGRTTAAGAVTWGPEAGTASRASLSMSASCRAVTSARSPRRSRIARQRSSSSPYRVSRARWT